MKKQDYLKHKEYQDKWGTTLLKTFKMTNDKQEMVLALYMRVYRFFYDDKKKDVEYFKQINKEIDEVIEVFPKFADALDHLASVDNDFHKPFEAFVFLRKSSWDDISYYFMNNEEKNALYQEQLSKVTHDPEYQTEEEKECVRLWNEKVADRMKWPELLHGPALVYEKRNKKLRYKTIEDFLE